MKKPPLSTRFDISPGCGNKRRRCLLLFMAIALNGGGCAAYHDSSCLVQQPGICHCSRCSWYATKRFLCPGRVSLKLGHVASRTSQLCISHRKNDSLLASAYSVAGRSEAARVQHILLAGWIHRFCLGYDESHEAGSAKIRSSGLYLEFCLGVYDIKTL